MTKNKRPFAQDFSGESKTQQHFTESCDVNNIVAAFVSTGIDPHAERLSLQKFGYASSQDFSEAMQNVAEVQSAFAALPSETRQEFGNDPTAWIEHLATPESPDEIIVESEPSEAPSEPPVLAPETPESEPN